MGNKPHRNKKLQLKALRKFSHLNSKEVTSPSLKTIKTVFSLKPFNQTNAKEMLKFFKSEVEHIHLKIKPHHHKRTTPGSVDPEKPQTITGHHNQDKMMKIFHKGDLVKSADLAKKYFRASWKKAA